jgi:hypothetical protein
MAPAQMALPMERRNGASPRRQGDELPASEPAPPSIVASSLTVEVKETDGCAG